MTAVHPADDAPAGAIAGPRAGATVVRMVLGAQLRRLREAAGITPEQAGYEIRASRSKISRLEHGRVGFKLRDVEDLLTLYGVTDEQMRAGLLSLAQQANDQGWWTQFGDILPDWFETYLGLEAAASLIRTFELQFVHGLFQTEDYARAVTVLGHRAAPAAEVDRRVSLRMARQQLLTAAQPPRVWSVMDEAALRRPVGGRDVMRAQLARLIEVADLPAGDPAGGAVPPRRARGGGRLVQRAAVRRAGPPGRGLHRAAHQRPVPGAPGGRGPLHGDHEPAERRGAHPGQDHPPAQRHHAGDLSQARAARAWPGPPCPAPGLTPRAQGR